MDIESILRIALTVVGAYLVVLWVGLVIWTYRDASARSKDPLFHLLALALVVIFNLAGLVLYLLLRPRHTLAEAYERSLEEEALLRELEVQTACSQCKRPVAADFLICPHCRMPLKQRCPRCQRALLLNWSLCPYCGQ